MSGVRNKFTAELERCREAKMSGMMIEIDRYTDKANNLTDRQSKSQPERGC